MASPVAHSDPCMVYSVSREGFQGPTKGLELEFIPWMKLVKRGGLDASKDCPRAGNNRRDLPLTIYSSAAEPAGGP
jgi:hypothetical protein